MPDACTACTLGHPFGCRRTRDGAGAPPPSCSPGSVPGTHDDVEALETVARVARRLAAIHDRPPAQCVLDEDPPAPAAGSWTLSNSNGMGNVVLGEN